MSKAESRDWVGLTSSILVFEAKSHSLASAVVVAALELVFGVEGSAYVEFDCCDHKTLNEGDGGVDDVQDGSVEYEIGLVTLDVHSTSGY